MPKFNKKTHTKDSPADHNYANDLEKRIGDAIDSVVDFNSFVSSEMGSTSFNNLWKHGIYRYSNSSQADSAVDSPKLGAGWLVVKTLGDYTDFTQIAEITLCYVVQEYTSVNGSVATRTYQSDGNEVGAWSDWKYMAQVTNNDTTIADRVIQVVDGANGRAYKYESGRLVCEIDFNVAGDSYDNWGGLVYTPCSPYNWTFPIPFVNNLVNVTGNVNGMAGYVNCDFISNTSANGLNLYRGTVNKKASSGRLVAEGRWK